MTLAEGRTLLLATVDADGSPTFENLPAPFEIGVPGVYEAAYLWAMDGIPVAGLAPGYVPTDPRFPEAGGLRVGLFRHLAHSAGKLNVADVVGGSDELESEDSTLHASATVDFEVVLSGRVDITLSDGSHRTLGPGSVVFVNGIAHSWDNHYDEDCLFLAVMVGANKA